MTQPVNNGQQPQALVNQAPQGNGPGNAVHVVAVAQNAAAQVIFQPPIIPVVLPAAQFFALVNAPQPGRQAGA